MEESTPTPCRCNCHTIRGFIHPTICCDKPSLGKELESSFLLSWNPYAGRGFSHYELEVSRAGMPWQPLASVGSVDVLSFVDPNDTHGKQKSYRIRTCLVGGQCDGWILLRPSLI